MSASIRKAEIIPHNRGSVKAGHLNPARFPDAVPVEFGAITPARDGYDFSRISLFAKTIAQEPPKLTTSQPGDIWEQGADHMAQQAMRTPTPDQPTNFSSGIAAGSFVGGNGGQSMHPLMRNFMESRFGFDFGRVKLHTDAAAAESAEAIHARAFTLGNDIVFGPGQYVPGSQATHSLLAHELAHVVQQGSGPSVGMPAILREVDATAEAGLIRQYIALICEIIAEIQRAIEEGQVWDFEEVERLRTDATLTAERVASLQGFIGDLDAIIQELESGSLTPVEPASRASLRTLWGERHPGRLGMEPDSQPEGHPARWTSPVGTRTTQDATGTIETRIVRRHSSYILNPPVLTPGVLPAASFPTWWVLACHSVRPPAGPTARGRETPETLGLLPNTVIFISRTGREITNWDWEPRTGAFIEASRPFGPHEWHYDETAGRVYIVVDGQQYNLLRNARVERQR